MEIHVSSDGQQHGPFPLEQVWQLVNEGQFTTDDLGWCEGMTDWAPLEQIIEMADLDAPAPAIPSKAPPPDAPPAFTLADLTPFSKPVAGASAYDDTLGFADMNGVSSSVRYGGFWVRFVALLIDGLVLFVLEGIVFVLFLTFTAPNVDLTPDTSHEMANYVIAILLLMPIGFIIRWLYFALMTSSSTRGTFGKMALGLKVTDCEGRRISFMQATGRFFGKIISSLLFGFGFLMAAFTKKKQALHDTLAGTLVVKK
jgi:uncharacterized RDD family membrane protein YckC